jgi:hypothetical protein
MLRALILLAVVAVGGASESGRIFENRVYGLSE